MRKILLIEDDYDLIESLADLLEISGYAITKASNGREGVEKALKEKPDLILCDVTMPVLDGFGVLHILSRHPDTFAIPFIFLTGRLEEANIRKGMGMGADDYLMKPFNEKELLDTIEVRIKKSESLKRNVLADRVVFGEYIQDLNGSGNLNLTTSRNVHHYKKRHLLYTQGDEAIFVYYVVEGRLKEFLINDDGKELITNMYTKGDFVGYTAVLQDVPYPESIRILDDTELIFIPKADFLQLINTDRQVARQFIKLLSHNIVEKEEKLLNLAYDSLRKKVAKGIIDVVDKFKDQKDGKPVVQISREDLASVIGSAQESMIRTLREFRMENLIDINDGSIYVLNENKLRNLQY